MAQPSRTARSHPLRGRLDCGACLPSLLFHLFLYFVFIVFLFRLGLSRSAIRSSGSVFLRGCQIGATDPRRRDINPQTTAHSRLQCLADGVGRKKFRAIVTAKRRAFDIVPVVRTCARVRFDSIGDKVRLTLSVTEARITIRQ